MVVPEVRFRHEKHADYVIIDPGDHNILVLPRELKRSLHQINKIQWFKNCCLAQMWTLEFTAADTPRHPSPPAEHPSPCRSSVSDRLPPRSHPPACPDAGRQAVCSCRSPPHPSRSPQSASPPEPCRRAPSTPAHASSRCA